MAALIRKKPSQVLPWKEQRLTRLYVKRLKNLIDLEIMFDANKPLTAIMGPNGFGKSTVLHLLAASFQKNLVGNIKRGEDYSFVNFFPNTPHGTWNNSNATISHYYEIGSNNTHNEILIINKNLGHWSPRAINKPLREIYFFGVKEAVPAIELEKLKTKVNYITSQQADLKSIEVLSKVGYVLNRVYSLSHTNKTKKGRLLIGVELQSINYSALTMGAGEQRLFHLLKVVQQASKNALVLIDELDLLLHTDALNRLLSVLNDYAQEKQLQIIFTTHRESVTNLEFQDFVAVRHLYQTLGKTLCFSDTKAEALDRLTGQTDKPLRISCEDNVATAIIQKVAWDVGIGHRIEYTKYGSSSNCFTLAAALVLKNEDLSKSLLVLDGDKQATLKDRHKAIDSSLSGTEEVAHQRKQNALECVRQFLPEIVSEIHPNKYCNPEEALHRLVIGLFVINGSEYNAVINTANEVSGIQGRKDVSKERFLKWQEKLGEGSQLERIVRAAATSPEWPHYTKEIREWLVAQKPLISEQH